MPTMHGASFWKASLRASRLILLRNAIFPIGGKPNQAKHVLANVDADYHR